MTLKIFSAVWCRPCKNLKKILQDSNIPHEIIDIDENPDQTRSYKVKSIPTSIFEENGEIIETIQGVYPAKKFQDIFSMHCAA
jgi:thioredoxin 1